MNQAPVCITYEFVFTRPRTISFAVQFDQRTGVCCPPRTLSPPDWARLEFRQCACCTLDAARVRRCPAALNIAGLVAEFSDIASFDPCTVRCVAPERTYVKDTDAQEGLRSAFGLLMATSGCPEFELFRPMARFHLPFSTPQETLVRLIATHVLRLYFNRGCATLDLALDALRAQYDRVQQVNEGVMARLRDSAPRDAGRNAVSILSSLAQIVTMELEDGLDSLKDFFADR
jgi:hypothetical protein